ncbi:MAG: DUF3570 domain-containing protein [Chlorobiaceae bacterium]|nr:DUF3570 domain-containing protein [Chlorobiaceae bacterium]
MNIVTTAKSTLYSTAFVSAVVLLPSLSGAYADAPPEKAVVAVKYLNYQDSQSGDTDITQGMSRDRIGVNALTFSGKVPVAGKWLIGGTFVEDSVTGASPAYHSSGFASSSGEHDTSSGASGELRHAGDLAVTRYFQRGSLTGGLNYSRESDYISRGCSLQGTLSTEDRNSTITLGVAFNNDSIDLGRPNVVASKRHDVMEKKQVFSGLIGLTQVVSKNDIVQVNAGYSKGHGFYTDPYKDPDVRPGKREMFTLLARWNHHFDSTEGTARLAYRYYSDTFGIRAHTLEAEYVQPLHRGWTLTPLLRLYSQSEADFYIATNTASPSDPTPVPPGTEYYSEDQRLGAFGAVTLGMKISKDLGKGWQADVKYEHYRQRQDWTVSGHGDPGVATFNARSIQVGISREI